MARNIVNTDAKLLDYIKMKLGSPYINVELSEDMILANIYSAIDEYAYYAYNGTVETSLLVQLEKNKNEYKLPYRTIGIRNLKATSLYSTFVNIPAGYTMQINPINMSLVDNISTIDVSGMTARMAKMSNLRNIFDIQVNYSYNANTQILTLHEKPNSDTLLLSMDMSYEPLPEDAIFDNPVIKKYAEGLSWISWSNVTGKYQSNLVNGTSINYDDMRSKGEAMVQEAKEEIMGLMEPLGVYIF